MPDDPLGYDGRVGIIGICLSIVVCAIFFVICFVKRGCLMYNYYFDYKTNSSGEFHDRDKLFIANPPPPAISYKVSPLHKRPDITLSSYTPTSVQFQKYDPLSPNYSAPPYLGAQNESNALLGSLTGKRDSTYSSMSENSGRTSPTASNRSSFEDSIGSPPSSQADSPVGEKCQGKISFSIQFAIADDERNSGKLIISILEARGLQGRQYMGGACDPFVKAIVWKERRSLRRTKPPPLHVVRSRTMRHTTEPVFNQSFVLDVNKADLRDLVVKLVAMDSDKWVSPTTLGEAVVPLKDLKGLATNPEKIPLILFLSPPKMDLGEILFGVSYLPTAQRLTVSVVKANRLKYQDLVEDITDFCPFVRALILNQSGRVIRRKKTTFMANTDKPIFNETLIFDLPDQQIEHVTFILAVCSRSQKTVTPLVDLKSSTPEPEDIYSCRGSSPSLHGTPVASPFHDRKQDKYLGKVVLGYNIPPGEEKQCWINILTSPRKVITQWHTLK